MSKNLQVQLIDQDLESTISLKKQLTNLGCAVVGESHFGVEAIALAQALKPESILLHLEEPVARALQTIEAIGSVAPNSPVVVLSHLGATSYVQKAMIAGAKGYLVQPVDAKAVQRALQQAYQGAQSRPAVEPETGELPKAGTVITVFGAKGGIGKTTIATNLAIGVQKLSDARVLLVDLDVQFGDAALMLDMIPKRSIADWLEEWNTNPDADMTPFLTAYSPHLSVLAARQRIGTDIPVSAAAITALLKQAARRFDYAIIDTPGTLNEAVHVALMESTLVLLVTTTDMASVKDARLCLEMMRSWGFSPDRVKLAINHSNAPNGVKPGDIEEVLNDRIFWTIPYDKAAVQMSQLGQPLVVSKPKAKVSRNLENLGAALTGAKPRQTSWLSNLLGRN
jgi:pilus assembly protein CpaE